MIYILSSFFLVPEDVAQLFVSFSATLREIVNPDCITAHLHAHNLITSGEKAEIDLQTFTPLVRMDKLLAAVHRAIKIDPNNYEIFVEILGKEKKYSTLVKELRGMFFTFIMWHCYYYTPCMYNCKFNHFLYMHQAIKPIHFSKIACVFYLIVVQLSRP